MIEEWILKNPQEKHKGGKQSTEFLAETHKCSGTKKKISFSVFLICYHYHYSSPLQNATALCLLRSVLKTCFKLGREIVWETSTKKYTQSHNMHNNHQNKKLSKVNIGGEGEEGNIFHIMKPCTCTTCTVENGW